MMGELEKLGQEAGDFFKLLRKLRRLEPREFLSMINNNPSVIDRLTAFYEGFAIFAEETSNKPLVELSPDEQIELGRRCKDFSLLVTELTDRTA